MGFFDLPSEKRPTRAQMDQIDREDIAYCAQPQHARYANSWERNFLIGVAGYKALSFDQREKLALIKAKIQVALSMREDERDRR